MRILHVVPTYVPAWRYGGPIHSVHGLCKALAARGHQVDVATTNVDGEGNTNVPLGVPVELDGVSVHYFPSTVLRRLYYSPGMNRFMRSAIAKSDILHAHSVFLWPTAAAAHIARRLKKPYVVSPRGMLVKDLIKRRSPIAKSAWIEIVEKRNINRASSVHVTSATEAEELAKLGFKPKRVFEVPNGVDLPEPPSQQTVPANDSALPRNYVLFLGRISWKKGIDRLLASMTHAPGIQLVVAGNDDEDYWPAMSRKAEEFSISNRVRYIGFIEGERKRQVLAGASVLALPSYSENFGNVVLEAMALGIPVIVTPEVGLSSAVQAHDAGWVVEGDPATFGSAILRLMEDEPLRKTIGENGRSSAAQYSWSSVAMQMEQQYLSVLG